ncbi:FAD-dependent oxidoreductase [Hydrogenophaga laconesensis]|uniref:D-amino-acid dehydrogenase n=1 Tax=Hydrogenophaga laconesensis TaxID=1805971 RepID=A0ABU1V4W7_9BURK|nr:FAD-dependent oxidoreductase [Hydrogenophaga laconesensis]MDR7092508.1 D-amino-acid dehydrogenase [Hydrogenophaga laconesensis]
MRIAVIGAGVVGTATAFELTRDGHEVTVYERRGTVAEEASFASGALVAAGWTAPWTQPERCVHMPWSSRHDGMQLARLPRGGEWRWLWRWLQSGKGIHQTEQHRQMHQWVRYSQERLQAITEELKLDHDRSQGMIVLWRTAREAELARPSLQQLKDLDIAFRELSPEQARALEPALSTDTPLHGAVELGGEAAANCREFALSIRAEAQHMGCRFVFNTSVKAMDARGPGGVALQLAAANAPSSLEDDRPRFDAVVVCAGVHSTALLQPLGLRVPLRPVYSHSLSAAVREPLDAPASAVLDAGHGVSIARLGLRVRVAGGCEFGSPPGQLSKATLRRLYNVLADWFPGAVRLGGPRGSVQEWCGAQATLPDGSPLLGTTRLPGVWLNLGHGSAGWSMACGTARALADQMSGATPGIDLTSSSPLRFGV